MRNKKAKVSPNLWKCPLCGKVVDYGTSVPSEGRTYCDKSDCRVQMVKVGGETVMSGDTDAAMDFIDSLADRWAADIRLVDFIKNLVAVGRLNRSAPNAIRERFIARQESLIDAFVRQAFVEGFLYGDENRANVDRIKRERTG